MHSLDKLTDQVVRKYFDDEQAELADIIREVALEQELNNNEINRIVQGANTKVFLRLYKATKDKTVEFDVATPEEVINSVGGVDSEVEFGDEAFIIRNDTSPTPSPEDNEGVELDESLLQQLAARRNELLEERDNLRFKILEKRPKVERVIRIKKQRHGEEPVNFAIKEAGLNPEGKVAEDGLVDLETNFLNKIASYANLKSRLGEVEETLTKIAGIFDAVKDTAGGAMKGLNTYSNITDVGNKAKKHTDKLNQTNNFGGNKRNTVQKYQGGIR